MDAVVTPVTCYMRSILTNPLFEFTQHGYNHYDYAQNSPPNCSASNAGVGLPQVVGVAAPYYEIGESAGPGQPVDATYASEFHGALSPREHIDYDPSILLWPAVDDSFEHD
jgi:hypothetical protein